MPTETVPPSSSTATFEVTDDMVLAKRIWSRAKVWLPLVLPLAAVVSNWKLPEKFRLRLPFPSMPTLKLPLNRTVLFFASSIRLDIEAVCKVFPAPSVTVTLPLNTDTHLPDVEPPCAVAVQDTLHSIVLSFQVALQFICAWFG